MENGPVEIVVFPSYQWVIGWIFPQFFVCLPDGILHSAIEKAAPLPKTPVEKVPKAAAA